MRVIRTVNTLTAGLVVSVLALTGCSSGGGASTAAWSGSRPPVPTQIASSAAPSAGASAGAVAGEKVDAAVADPEAFVAFVKSMGPGRGTDEELLDSGQKSCDALWSQGKDYATQKRELVDARQYPQAVIDHFLLTRSAALVYLCPQFLTPNMAPGGVLSQIRP